MGLQNFGCTLTKPSRLWITPLSPSGESFAHSVPIHVLLSRPVNSGVKPGTDSADSNSLSLAHVHPYKAHPKRRQHVDQKLLTCKHTSCTPSMIMCLRSGCTEPLIPIQCSWWGIPAFELGRCCILIHVCSQGEREHRVGKGRLLQTSRKDFICQLAQIERRQLRIWRIRERVDATHQTLPEPIPNNPKEHYQIGKSQNYPVDVSNFSQQNSNDPAVKVSDARRVTSMICNVNLGL